MSDFPKRIQIFKAFLSKSHVSFVMQYTFMFMKSMINEESFSVMFSS